MAPLRWAYARWPKFKNRNLKILGKFKKTQIKNNSLHKQTYHMEAWEKFKQQALLHHWRQQNLAAQLAQQEASQQPLAQRPDGARRCHAGAARRRPWPHNSLRLPAEWRPGQVVQVEVLPS